MVLKTVFQITGLMMFLLINCQSQSQKIICCYIDCYCCCNYILLYVVIFPGLDLLHPLMKFILSLKVASFNIISALNLYKDCS